MTLQTIETEVLIIGNGPVGATMSCYLGKYGVETLVIDRAADILTMPRAIALDNEALRILQNAGLEESAFAKQAIKEVRMKSPLAGLFGRGNTSGSIDGHPKLVTFYQPELERALRDKAAELPSVTAMASTSLLEFSDEGDYVRAVIENAEGTQTEVIARYLIGADGASSMVRDQLGLAFKGESYAEDWLIVDAINRNSESMNYVEFECSPKMPTPHMPAPGGRERWEFMLSPKQNREAALDDTYIRGLLKKWVGNEHVEIERKAVYRFHARCSKTFQKGQVFLVGDAAHITPPFVGQGLVAGLRDVANLSWKLAWVLNGSCSDKTLKTYDRERRPHASSMINMARRMGGMIMPQNFVRAAVVHNLMKGLRLIEPARAYLEELEIKPKNRFKKGLFTNKFEPKKSQLQSGAMIPQGLVRDHTGAITWSDSKLSDSFCLLGIGLNPSTCLNEKSQDLLNGLGANLIQVSARRTSPPQSGFEMEDLDNAFLAKTGHKEAIVLVRPDRVIMGHCPPAKANQLISRLAMSM